MSKPLAVQALKVLEWYDGIVSGFVQSQSSIFLCVLLAFDANVTRRCYALVPVEANGFPTITADEFEGYLKSAIRGARTKQSAIYVTRKEPIVGEEIELDELTNKSQLDQFELLRFPRIDDAVLPSSLKRWF